MGVPYAEVIGDPVAHSKSPLIHHYWLTGLDLPGEYRRTRVRPGELAEFLRERRADPDWRGCNVTVPHKEAILAYLDRIDGDAAQIGAVNCVVPRPEGLVGYNSDIEGVVAALNGVELAGAKAALVGAGGAARAALASLTACGVREVAIVARNPEKADCLGPLAAQARLVVGSFDQCRTLFAEASVIINASPLGMEGCPPMPNAVLAAVSRLPAATVFDMVYSPIETRFLAAAQGRRVNGLAMLV
ncbi:shikimate dehydrogenase, partial [Sphingomonas sp.]|uniref:shikimate dehydrogenase family protein n=1 Tax=Sphingomonas sp. TaxID=28214 RepID=UPI0025F6B3C3